MCLLGFKSRSSFEFVFARVMGLFALFNYICVYILLFEAKKNIQSYFGVVK